MFSFQTFPKNETFFVKFPKIVSESKIQELRDLLNQWQKQQEKEIIFDFEFVSQIQQSCFQPLITFARDAKKFNKSLFTIHVSPQFHKEIKKLGLETTFNVMKNYSEVQTYKERFNKLKYKIDIRFVGPFIKSAIDTLAMEAGTPSKPGKPFYKKGDSLPSELDFLAELKFDSQKFSGKIYIGFTAPVFKKISESLFTVIEKVDSGKENESLLTKLCSLIYEAGKASIPKDKEFEINKFNLSIFKSEEIKNRTKTDFPIVVIPLTTQSGDYYIEITSDPS